MPLDKLQQKLSAALNYDSEQLKKTSLLLLDKPQRLHSENLASLFLQQLQLKDLYPIFEPEKQITGALIFSNSKSKANKMKTYLKNSQVLQTFWFVTDKVSNSSLNKTGHLSLKNEISIPTEFTRIKRNPFFELWQAKTMSATPNEIRIHCQQSGLSILGDTEYQGTQFPTLCLHCLSIEFPDEPKWTTPAPRYFERLGILKDPLLIKILIGIDTRQRLYNFTSKKVPLLTLFKNKGLGIDLKLNKHQLHLKLQNRAELNETEAPRWIFIATNLNREILVTYGLSNKRQIITKHGLAE